MTSRGIDVLDEAECRLLLSQQSVGRVGVKLGDRLAILPVYYALYEGDVVFRTDPGTKLNAAVLRTQVAFEVDDPGPPRPWSVLVLGHAAEIRLVGEQMGALAHLGYEWPTGERGRLVRIRTEELTGRRLRPAASKPTASQT
jgi:nitroimidazol reductase NimA-like FMN-containing flavoprotein (pyridoxamine 5'-phosphate oxidase superfamily)